ncbi:unnamed protein product, partial [Effrenium voratum]
MSNPPPPAEYRRGPNDFQRNRCARKRQVCDEILGCRCRRCRCSARPGRAAVRQAVGALAHTGVLQAGAPENEWLRATAAALGRDLCTMWHSRVDVEDATRDLLVGRATAAELAGMALTEQDTHPTAGWLATSHNGRRADQAAKEAAYHQLAASKKAAEQEARAAKSAKAAAKRAAKKEKAAKEAAAAEAAKAEKKAKKRAAKEETAAAEAGRKKKARKVAKNKKRAAARKTARATARKTAAEDPVYAEMLAVARGRRNQAQQKRSAQVGAVAGLRRERAWPGQVDGRTKAARAERARLRFEED